MVPEYREPVGQATRRQAVQARIKMDGRAITPTALSCRQRQRSAAREIPNAAMHHVSPGAGSNFRELPGSGTAINRLLVLGLFVQDMPGFRLKLTEIIVSDVPFISMPPLTAQICPVM
jgi:hypothetical protein